MNFPLVSGSPSSPHSTSFTKHAPAKKSNSSLPLLLAGGGGIIVLLIGVAIFFALNSSPGSTKKQSDHAKAGKNGSKTKSTTGTLVLDWPEAERAGGRISIGSERKTFPTTGPIEFKLKPGTHSITIQRRGFEPAHLDVTIVAGEEARERPAWKEVPQVAFNPPPGNSGVEPEPFNTQPFTPADPTGPPAADPFAQPQPNPQPAEPTPTPVPRPQRPAPVAAPEPYSVDREPGPVNQPALTISAEELTRRFAANEATALSMYGNDAFIQVDGIVESPFAPLDSEFGGGWIRLHGEEGKFVYCHVVQPWAEYCKLLRAGHIIRIVGTKVGFHPDDKRVVVIQFCEFQSNDHRKSGASAPKPGPLLAEFDEKSLKELSIYKGQKPQLKTTAVQITELFATKEGVADETYGNDTMFEITGVITAVNLPADGNTYPSLMLKGHGVWQAELRFQHQWRDMLTKQKIGATVKLIAHHARKDFGNDNQVWIDGAEFVLE